MYTLEKSSSVLPSPSNLFAFLFTRSIHQSGYVLYQLKNTWFIAETLKDTDLLISAKDNLKNFSGSLSLYMLSFHNWYVMNLFILSGFKGSNFSIVPSLTSIPTSFKILLYDPSSILISLIFGILPHPDPRILDDFSVDFIIPVDFISSTRASTNMAIYFSYNHFISRF